MSDPAYEAVCKARRQDDGGNPEGAAETLKAYLSTDPSCESARLELARLFIYRLEMRDVGIEQLQVLLEEHPDNIDALKAATTVMMTNKRFRKQVDEDYRHLIELIAPRKDPAEYAKVCAAYAVFLRQQMVDFEGAAKYFELALQASPKSYEYHQDYAVLLLHDLKDYMKAKEELEIVLELRPNSISARKNYDLLMKTKFDSEGNLKKKGLLSRLRH